MKPIPVCPHIVSRTVAVRPHKVSGYREQGSVLVISLLILLIMSLLSISSLNNSVLEEKMAANSRNNQKAFQAAEAALRAAEFYVSANMDANTDTLTGNVVDTSCTNGLCDCDNRDTSIGGSGVGTNGCPLEYWTDTGVDAWTGAFKQYLANWLVQDGSDAKYIVEYMGKTQNATGTSPDPRLCSTCPDMYRITALGIHTNSGARVRLQSTFQKQN